jgi:hypothetical protein
MRPRSAFQDQEWHSSPSAILTGTLSSTPVSLLQVSKYSLAARCPHSVRAKQVVPRRA